MKKIVAFLLVVVMCLSLVACGSGSESKEESEKEIKREIISVSTLIADLDNLARAEQNVGKATHLFGTISSIGTDAFTLSHLFIGKSFSIPMDTAVLAELNKGDYIAVYAVVDEINSGNFIFKDCKQIEMELMDEYVVNQVSTVSTEALIKTHNDTVVEYIMSRGDTFKMTGDDEIASYILGKWYQPYPMGLSGTYIARVEYFANGECIWQSWDEYFNEWDDAYCDWSVKDGILNGNNYYGTAVYKITSNAMVTGGELLIRAQ